MTPEPRLSLGVVGHVDHGKTALVRALTGMETDRLPEEQRRGVSIALGFAHARFGEAEVDFIDMPGHERFVRTLISGATGVGALLLVVAANEGVKPQTVEHLEIAALLGLERISPVIAKADLVDPAQAAATAAATLELARACGLDPAPALVVSALTGEGMDALRAAIGELALAAPQPADDGFPWLPVDRAFSIAGRGTVVTGTLRRGRLGAQDALALAPGGAEVRVRGLQVHGADVAFALPGQRVAVNLRGLEPGQAPRGIALSAPGVLVPTSWITVEVRAIASAPPLRTGVRLSLLFGAAEVAARLRLLDRDVLQPGETAFAQLNTLTPVAAPGGERFVLRRPSPAATVAGGRVLDPAAGRLRRGDAEGLRRLAALAEASPLEAVRLTLSGAGAQGAALHRLAALAGLAPARVADALAALGAEWIGGDRVVDRAVLTALAGEIVSTLRSQAETQPNGVARRRLAGLLPHAAPAAIDAVVGAMATAGRLEVEGGAVRLPAGRDAAAARAAQEAALAAALSSRLRTAGLSPPNLAELAATPAARRALDRLLKAGEAVRTVDQVQKRELVFHREAVADAKARLAPRLAPPGLTLGEAGGVLGVSRKFSLPLLEYLDAVRFTRRLGDRRVLGPAGKA